MLTSLATHGCNGIEVSDAINLMACNASAALVRGLFIFLSVKKISLPQPQPAAKAVGFGWLPFWSLGGVRYVFLPAAFTLVLDGLLGLSSSGKNPIGRLGCCGGSGGVTLSANSRSVSNTWRS